MPLTTEARLVAITFKGAYLSEENLVDLNAAFATSKRLGRDGDMKAVAANQMAQQKLAAISPETTFHYK